MAQTWPAGQSGIEVARARPTYPFNISAQLYLGAQVTPNGKHEAPVAFGAMLGGLWKNTVGLEVGILSSGGSRLKPASNGETTPPDRLSVPLALAVRPLAPLGWSAMGWASRLYSSFEIQLGPDLEHIQNAEEGKTMPALHVALAMDIPIYLGSAVEGGVTFRLYARGVVAPHASLAQGALESHVFTPQIYFGVVYYP